MLQKAKQPLALTGYLLLPVSLLILLIQIYRPTAIFNRPVDLLAGPFLLLYVISAAYFIAILFKHVETFGWKQFEKGDELLYSIALILFSISAHSLNIAMDSGIFASYPAWLTIYMILIHLAILVFPYRQDFAEELQYLVYFACGTGLVLSLYFTIYLVPIMLISIPGSLVFGISSHAFVALWFLIQFIQDYRRMGEFRYSRTAYWLGVMVPVMFLVIYLGRWHGMQKKIEEIQFSYKSMTDPLYPEWVVLSQQLPEGAFAEMVILGEATSQNLFTDSWNQTIFRSSSTRAMLHHNPLAVIARLCYGSLNIGRETMIPLLNSRYDLRHMTHRRLWSGDHLKTTEAKTDIDLFPEYRIAYLEKTLRIKDAAYGRHEAVYSFYLPEGAIATSLSLWIEGEERKSRLTTKTKADSAYQTIVGVESRDPALMHWQEGNRLTVTVFPCTIQEDRLFKIGLTIPLGYESGKLSLGKVYFDGPPPAGADEEIKLIWHGPAPENLDIPGRFEQNDAHTYVFQGSYLPYWELSFDAPPLSTDFFQFNNKRFSIEALAYEERPVKLETVILDLNAKWSWREFQEVWEMVKGKKVMAYGPEPVVLTPNNCEKVFSRFNQKKFSLLPLYQIENPSSTLVVSKGVHQAPLLKDLEGSLYADQMRDWLKKDPGPLMWLDLGATLSPYVKTLKNFRLLTIKQGDTGSLEDILSRQVFPQEAESENQIVISHSEISLTATPVIEEERGSGPDHLMRLYVYQDLLRKMSRDYFDSGKMEDFWTQYAEEAYIVTPVSSLVVLESVKDYNRFGIGENTHTLGNASLKNEGAVPEPHEWVLIVLVLLIAIWQGKKRLGLS